MAWKPQETTEVFLYLAKKNPLETSSSHEFSCGSRCNIVLIVNIDLREEIYNKVQTNCCPQEQEVLIVMFFKKTALYLRLFGRMKPRWSCTRMMGREKFGEGKEQILIWGTQYLITCQTWWWHSHSMVIYGCLEELGHWCLLMMWLLM